jgi:hypothetical protein
MDRALDQSLISQNIRFGFKVIGIWPLNPKTMDNQIAPSTIYLTTLVVTLGNEEGEKGEGENDYILGDQVG